MVSDGSSNFLHSFLYIRNASSIQDNFVLWSVSKISSIESAFVPKRKESAAVCITSKDNFIMHIIPMKKNIPRTLLWILRVAPHAMSM